MKRIGTALLLLFSSNTLILAAQDPITGAADYYYSRQDYAQALPLWQQLLKRNPENINALARVCEMKLYLENRASCRNTLVTHLTALGSKLTPELRDSIKALFEQFESVFITDEGQTAFLVGQARFSVKDWAGALSQLETADNLEQGNIRVLRLKANAEKNLGRFDALHQTLVKIRENHPLDENLWDSYLESLFNQREYDKLTAEVRLRHEGPTSVRGKTAYALALAESGRLTEALPLLQALTSKERASEVHPRLWFEQGRIFGARPSYQAEAILSLERFMDFSQNSKNCERDGWDPFHCEEVRVTASKLLDDLKKNKAMKRL